LIDWGTPSRAVGADGSGVEASSARSRRIERSPATASVTSTIDTVVSVNLVIEMRLLRKGFKDNAKPELILG
jgi:hypothetical protein